MFNDLQAHKVIGGGNTEPPLYSRPADWLPLPTVTEADEKIVVLMPVYDIGPNRAGFYIGNGCIVDWGDGTVEEYDAWNTSEHFYDWSQIPASTLTSDGFRQCIITITPKLGESLAYVNTSSTSLGTSFYQSFLEIEASLPNAQTLDFGTQAKLRKIVVHNTGSLQYWNAIGNCLVIEELVIKNASQLQSFTGNSYTIKGIKILNALSLESLDSSFEYCSNLKELEVTNLNSLTSAQGTFYYCGSLSRIKLTGLTSVTSRWVIDDIWSSIKQEVSNIDLSLQGLNALTAIEDTTFAESNIGGSLEMTGLSSITSLWGVFELSSFEKITLTGLTSLINAKDVFYESNVREVIMTGTSNTEEWDSCFNGCNNLVNAPDLDTSSAISMGDMFYGCSLMKTVPLYNTSNATSMARMFAYCSSLQAIPDFDTSSCVDFNFYNGFLEGCVSLTEVPILDFSSTSDMSAFFRDCQSLIELPALVFTASTTFWETFHGCPRLTRAPLQGIAQDVSLTNNMMPRTAIIELFNGLATVTGKTINITGCLGVPDLTEADIEIATNKGWTVIL